jgi:hypothetical protein
MASPKVTKDIINNAQPDKTTVTACPLGQSTISDPQADSHESSAITMHNPYAMDRWLAQKPKDEPWNGVRKAEDKDSLSKQ